MNDVAFKLRDRLRQERDVLVQRFNAGGSVDTLLRGLARSVDRLLKEVAEASGITSRATLIAVGGYGRGELFPHSDVDVLILLNQPATDDDARTIENLVSLLWDLGLPLGHSVRTLDECLEEARRDITVLTAMLESRLLVGARSRFAAFSRAIVDSLDREAYFRAKLLEQQHRHIKYDEAPVQPRTQCQGGPRRVARPAGRRLGRACQRLRRKLVGAGTARVHHDRRGPDHSAQRAPHQADPRPTAPGHRAPRGSPGIRRAGRGGAAESRARDRPVSSQ